jgi:hypothetical protein
MRKLLIVVPVSAITILMAANSVAFAGGNSGPIVRDHRNGSSQGGSSTSWGDGTVRDHRHGSTSGWGDGANVRDHRKPIIEFKGLF